jgi:hypothetical protein
VSGGGRRFACWTKATTREAGAPRFSASWIAARRGRLELYDDRLVLGDWTVPVAAIRAATLFRLRGLVGGSVLEVATAERTYQFGLNPWVAIERHLPFPFAVERVALRYSALAVALRVVLVVWLVYVVWERWLSP